MMLNPENQLLQSFQNPQQPPLGSLWGSRKTYAQVHQLHPDKRTMGPGVSELMP